MKTPSSIALPLAIAVGAALLLGFVDRQLKGRPRAIFRYVAAIVAAVGFFYGVGYFVDEHAVAVDWAKGAIALTAAACCFYEAHRNGEKRPIAERWKKFVGVTLGVMAIVAYFNGFKFGYPKYYHRWDQYHYYMGAKYFREFGYDGLYKCTLIAQHELGTVEFTADNGKTAKLDMKKEVEHPDKKIRNLGGDNLLMPANEVLKDPDQCRKLFSPERWELYKEDVKFFRTSSDKGYWEDMQKDHGYNPPPVWTVMGWVFGNLHPATVNYLQFLASLDIAYLFGTFAILWWAFGWRVFAVAAIFWGTQSSAPFYWTGGAFLRQDWLFFLTAAAAFTRKGFHKLAGASMVYAGLLRVFPGLAVIGWLTTAGIHLWRHKRMAPIHKQTLVGGVLAAAILIPASVAVSGTDSYRQFFEHTLKVHDMTPLTNHMGLRVLVGQKSPIEIKALGIGTGVESGRMEYTKDTKRVDPFELWKDMRNQRYAKYKLVAYAICAAIFVLFVQVLRRFKSLWIAQCFGQIWIILLSQLTCYYYSFMILSAPLTKLDRRIEPWLFGLAFLTQVAWRVFYWNDDKYWVLTALSLAFCLGLLFAFRKGRTEKLPATAKPRPTNRESHDGHGRALEPS